MAAHAFNIMALPLELFRVILAQAMHVREIKRAVRLRLVNKFFAVEVMQTLENTWFLEDCELSKTYVDPIGSDFMARRLLAPSMPVCSRWDGLRRVARRLTIEDNDDSQENYAKYIHILSHRASGAWGSLKNLCDPKYRSYGDCCYQYDLMCAAAYFGKISLIEELGNNRENLKATAGASRTPYIEAIDGNNHAVVDLLFSKVMQHGQDPRARQVLYLSHACNSGDITMARKFLPDWSQEELGIEPTKKLLEAMKTPSVEAFEMLRHVKEKMEHPDLDRFFLGGLLIYACQFGWEDMATHLIGLGAPVQGEEDGGKHEPVREACESGSEFIVRLLLQHGADIQDNALGTAAKHGNWNLVWILIDEYGVDPNIGDNPPIIWAIKDEEERDMQTLLDRGAKLDGAVGVKAVNAAQAEGLESMLAWLEEHGVDVAKIKSEQKQAA